MASPSYFEVRLVVRQPYNEKPLVKLASERGFSGSKLAEDDASAKAGDYIFTTTENGRDRLEARVADLVNTLRTTGHAKNTGVYTINPRT